MKTNKKKLGKEQNTKIESEKTENNKSIETDEKNSTTIEGKKPSLDDLSPKSKKFAKIYNAVRFLVIIAAGVALIYASYSLTESYLNYKDDEKKYASLNDMFVQDAKGNTGSDSSAGLNGNKARFQTAIQLPTAQIPILQTQAQAPQVQTVQVQTP